MCAAPFLLLVNPWITDFAAYDLWAKPVGLLMLASLLRRGGCRVAFVDCLDRYDSETNQRADVLPPTFQRYGTGKYPKVPIAAPEAVADLPRRYYRYGIHPDDLRRRLNEFPRPDLIWVTSGMTYWYPGIQQTIALVREIHPGVPIWLGGIYARLCTQHARKHSGATQVVTTPLAQLPTQVEASLGFRLKNHKAWGNLPSSIPLAQDLHPDIYAPLLTSLGCPHRCPYCASSILQPHWMRFSAEAIVDQVQHWHSLFGTIDFVLYDDALLMAAESTLKPALETIQSLERGVRFHSPNGIHIGMLSDEWCQLLFDSGFTTLRLGLETTQAKAQQRLGGKVDTRMFLSSMTKLHFAGFSTDQIGVYLLCGLPGQTPQEVAEAIQLVKDTGAKPFLCEYSPIPGTLMFNQLLEKTNHDLLNEPLTHNNSFFACRRPDFTYQDLLDLKQQARLARSTQDVV